MATAEMNGAATRNVPPALVQLREQARGAMRLWWQRVKTTHEADVQRRWESLLERLRAEMQPDLIQYLDRDDLYAQVLAGCQEAWPTFRVPGHWPVMCRYWRAVMGWGRTGTPDGPIDGDYAPWWRVVKSRKCPCGCETCETFGCRDLGGALAVAQMSEREMEAAGYPPA